MGLDQRTDYDWGTLDESTVDGDPVAQLAGWLQDAERLGAGRKSLVVTLALRSGAGTLSGEEAGRVVDAVVAECGRRVNAVLRG